MSKWGVKGSTLHGHVSMMLIAKSSKTVTSYIQCGVNVKSHELISPCKPGAVSLYPRFSSLLDETSNRGPFSV